MKIMYKKITLFLMCSLLVGAVHAGPGPGRLTRKASAVKKKVVTHVLQKRADLSYKKAVSKLRHQTTDLLTKEFPADHSAVDWAEAPFQAKDLYPNVSFLTDNKQADLYLRRKINSEIIKDAALHNKLYDKTLQHLEDFKQAKREVTHESEEDVAWLAKQIGPDMSYVLFGENHGMPKVLTTLPALIKTLREQQPERKIFLFTELMYHKTHTVVNPFYEEMFAKLESDEALNVPVIGLDMEIVEDTIPVLGSYGHYINATDFWITREGLRLRNAYWLSILKKYRAENPDALFIIHGGSGHMRYTEPYSMGLAFKGPQTFVISYVPGWDYTYFDRLTKSNFIQDRVLQFEDEELSRLAGFDVQIRVFDLF